MPPEVQLAEMHLPMRRPLSNARGSVGLRSVVLVAIEGSGATGWGEAAPYPGVTAETVTEVWDGLVAWAGGNRAIEELPPSARSAVDQARADLAAHRAGEPLWSYLGGTGEPVRACAAIGLGGSLSETLDWVASAVASGIHEVKVKIEPGRDLAVLSAIRRRFPTLAMAADANGSFGTADRFFRTVDALGLTYLEQPLPPEDLAGHRELRRRISTPVCLDESTVTTGAAVRALEMGAADIVSVKPGLVGVSGVLRVTRLAESAGVELKVGGLVESSVGRAHALHLASLRPIRHTDLVPPRHWLSADVATPQRWNLHDGHLPMPDGAGLGLPVDPPAGDAARYLTHQAAFPGK